MRWTGAAAALAVWMALSAPALAARCGRGPDGFDDWLQGFKQEAASAGISRQVIESALGNVAYDDDVISHDRGQRAFGQSFATFSSRHITAYGLKKGKNLLRRYAEPLQTIESRYGVPGAVLIAIWGLETGFGSTTGKYDTFSALATLAYDCRRSEKFHEELLAALKIVQRGDLRRAKCAAPGRARSARPSSCRPPISNMEAATSSTIPSTRSPPPPISCARTAGRKARAGTRGRPTTRCCWSGTPPAFTPRRSACSPTSSMAGAATSWNDE